MQIKVKFEYYMISIFACEMLMAVLILNSNGMWSQSDRDNSRKSDTVNLKKRSVVGPRLNKRSTG